MKVAAGAQTGKTGSGKSPQHYYREFVTSISLHDADKSLLMGVPKPDQSISWLPLTTDEQLIGYLGFVKPGIVGREAGRRFMAHVLRVFGIISLVILVISIGVATFFACRISKPIVTLSEHTQALASGDYSRRIDTQSGDEIGQLCRHFNQLAQTLQANEQSRAHWIADISHEMRTPVSVLQAQIEALQDGVRPLNRECLELLHSKVSGLSALGAGAGRRRPCVQAVQPERAGGPGKGGPSSQSERRGLTRRPEALPYWSHSRGVREADGYFAPLRNNSDLDGVSGATPKSDYRLASAGPVSVVADWSRPSLGSRWRAVPKSR